MQRKPVLLYFLVTCNLLIYKIKYFFLVPTEKGTSRCPVYLFKPDLSYSFCTSVFNDTGKKSYRVMINNVVGVSNWTVTCWLDGFLERVALYHIMAHYNYCLAGMTTSIFIYYSTVWYDITLWDLIKLEIILARIYNLSYWVTFHFSRWYHLIDLLEICFWNYRHTDGWLMVFRGETNNVSLTLTTSAANIFSLTDVPMSDASSASCYLPKTPPSLILMIFLPSICLLVQPRILGSLRKS